MPNEEVLELQIRDNAGVAAAALESLATSLTKVKDAVGKGLHLKGTISSLEKLKEAVNTGLNEESINKFERLATTLERLKSVGGLKIAGIKNIANQLDVSDSLGSAKEQIAETANDMTTAIDRGMEHVESRSRETASSFSTAWSSAKDKIKEVWGSFSSLVAKANEDGSGHGFFATFKEGIDNARGSVSGLLGDFARIVKYRAIRSVIKQITSAFSEGIKNMYFYSKAIGGDFAASMNDAASSLLQFKNSIGAAAAPLIQSLIPYLQQVIGYAIQAINYINQFLALLRGQTVWTRALYKATDAFDDTKKKAKGAGKAMKDLLADWDELNIIQSESGGGGGAGKAVEDYTKMFEETSDFDRFLKDNFSSILDTVKKIGLLIGAWKLSKTFSGLLGKLFKIAAGGLLVSVGIDLSYGAGFDMGVNGFSTKNIVEGLVGTLATAIGGSMITSAVGLGGGVGFAIGFGVALVATLIGYIRGQKDLEDKNKWGNLTMTRDQIEQFVLSQFSFDVVATVNMLDGVINNETEAKTKLDEKITTFKNSLTDATIQAKIAVDSSATGDAVTQAYKDSQEAIKAVEGLLKANKEGISVIMDTFTFTDAEGNDISKDMLEKISVADQSVQDYFTDIGRKLAHWINVGETQGFSEEVTSAALALMQRQQKIFDEAEKMKSQMDFEKKMGSSFNQIIDRDTAKTQWEIQKQYVDEYKQKSIDALNTQYDTALYLAALAQSSANDALEQAELAKKNGDTAQYNYYMGQYTSLTESVETYQKEADEALGKLNNFEETLKETQQNFAKQWAETLKAVYGSDFERSVSDRGFKNFIESLTSLSKYGDTEKASKEIREHLIKLLGGDDPNGIVNYVLNDLQGNLFDLFSDEMRKSLYNSLLKETNYDYDAVSELLQGIFGMSESEIKEAFKEEFAVRKHRGWKGEWKVEDPNAWDDGREIEEEWLDLDAESKVNITIDPVLDEQQTKQKLKDFLEYAVTDYYIDEIEEGEILRRFGETLYKRMLEEMSIEVDPMGNVTFGKVNNNGTLADTGLFNYGANPIVTPAPATPNNTDGNEKLASQIGNEMKAANVSQNEYLSRMVTTLTQLLAKEWSVNVYPSSGWGEHNQASNNAYEKVHG